MKASSTTCLCPSGSPPSTAFTWFTRSLAAIMSSEFWSSATASRISLSVATTADRLLRRAAREAARHLKWEIPKIHVVARDSPRNFPAFRQISKKTSTTVSSASDGSRSRRSTNANTLE